ncbi:MAG: glycoside hydrolase, partial [Phormidesmis sp. CAN_BIN36]|nr:glycoside hydrolase [Phormidesmis sp. CAN_BIN36]
MLPDSQNPLEQAIGVYITVHGHFYQPPRENPYLDAIERQPSAAPFHNWNERIHHECYRPNAFARVLNDHGDIVKIVNNFEYLSFNIGPTLMSWIERYDLEVYQRILDADRKSCDRLNGHGNAIAQAYNHMILPLANQRDKQTQIRWGKADFRSHFGRDPEGMWLAETAVDEATVTALIAEGIQFIILAPSQAQRCRPLDEPNLPWNEVGGGQIDTTRPYRCFLKKGYDRTSDPCNLESDPASYLDIFFYDGPISRDMGFDSALSSSHNLASRLGQAVRGDHRPAQLIAVATDGETFGHHKAGTEKCLAYAFDQEFPHRGWTVTNFAHYLSLTPPTWEVELKPVTAWSCAHGVDRWQD